MIIETYIGELMVYAGRESIPYDRLVIATGRHGEVVASRLTRGDAAAEVIARMFEQQGGIDVEIRVIANDKGGAA